MTAGLQLVTDTHESDRALARRAVSGDEAAFAELYRMHSGRVFALCVRMCGSRERAVELVQDVFVHIWERLGSFRGESALASWIHRLTVNLILSNVRTETRRLNYEVPDDDEGRETRDGERAGLTGRGSVKPASVLEAVDLERAIATLPVGARVVFVLHDVEGYQHAEIARMTGTAEGTCRAQLHRARKLLMEALNR
ncbi:MAG TPA: RNA polymerase sigma factor [Gemmatimonadaceae bacterium]|nr:RNA polymerase sigma factor [Gemmatimonadaceae bacterium]